MSGFNIAFAISQTGRRKAGCGYYAAGLIDGLLAKSENNYHYTALTSFGNFFHDPCKSLAFPHAGKGVRYGPQGRRRTLLGEQGERGALVREV